MDDRQAAMIQAWMNEADDENDDYQVESSSDEEVDYLEEQNHEYESEQEQDRGVDQGETSENDELPLRRRHTNFYNAVLMIHCGQKQFL
ncbi:hypothetical protein HHI36_010347 [Cryptolaemus montrouzieri]|uniref:Uncharacterized protein n=1 Tax=Cryptolaemus montrouzieri TaxID=559131 RepID=A0ABD2MIM2_9CUCU